MTKEYFKGEKKLQEQTRREFHEFQETARKEASECKKGKYWKY